MFLASQRTLAVATPAARLRLVSLAGDGGLRAASEAAYRRGLTLLTRVGPSSGVAGTSRLAGVRVLEPVDRGPVTTVGLRWEATGTAAGLFPVLDANVTLIPNGEAQTWLAFAGAYRLPVERPGVTLDRTILHTVATTTVRTLLSGISRELISGTGRELGAPAPGP